MAFTATNLIATVQAITELVRPDIGRMYFENAETDDRKQYAIAYSAYGEECFTLSTGPGVCVFVDAVRNYTLLTAPTLADLRQAATRYATQRDFEGQSNGTLQADRRPLPLLALRHGGRGNGPADTPFNS